MPLLNDIIIIFGLSAGVLYLCHRLQIPTIVGYLLTGVLVGPYGLGWVKEVEAVQLLAEVGVVSLLFTIGLEFSFRSLLQIKRSVLLGGSLQVLFTVIATILITQTFGHSVGESVFIGFITALSSTAIVMKILQERAEVETPHGNTALGILIFQDIIVVPMILITPFLGGTQGKTHEQLLILLAEEAGIVVLIAIWAKYVVPKLFFRIAQTKNRELFSLSVIVMCLAVAWLTHHAGLSLALGAFLAGLVISESEYSHQALGSILPFKDVFTSFFFILIGMLLDITFFFRHPIYLLFLAAGVYLMKAVLAASAVAIMGLPVRTFIIAGLSLGQIGEFSFILSQTGIQYGFLAGDIYQRFLAISVLTMMITPFAMEASSRVSELVHKLPLPRKFEERFLPGSIP